MDFEKLGKRVREERLKLRLTQEELSEKVGISSNFLGQIERGDRKLSVDTLVSLANALEVSVNYLLSDSLEFSADSVVKETVHLLAQMPHKRKAFVLDFIRRFQEIP